MSFSYLARLIAASSVFLYSLSSLAQTDFDILIDTDINATTGCSITPTGGATLSGFEERLRASVDPLSLDVVALEQSSCAGSSFGAAAPVAGFVTPYPIALNTGLGGADAVELAIARSVIGGAELRLAFVSDDGAGSDQLSTVDGSASGTPIVFGFGPVLPVPALSLLGLAALVLVLMALAWMAHHKLGRAGTVMAVMFVATAVWAMDFALDGDLSDWSGQTPDATDPTGDPTDSNIALDLVAGFISLEGGNLFFRLDVLDIENQAPTAIDDSFTTDEDTALNVVAPGVLINDNDPESDALTATLNTGPGNGTLTLYADGSFAYTPDPDYNGDDSFTYTADDATGSSAPATVTITVSPINDAPTFTSTAVVSALEDELYSYSISAEDVDGDSLTISAPTLPTWLASGFTDNGDGTASLTGTPTNSDVGDHNVVLEVTDGPETATQSFTITVDDVNDAPTATDDSLSVDEGGTVTETDTAEASLLANDSDPDGNDLVLTTTPVVAPATGSLTLNADGTFSFTHDGSETSSDSFTYEVCDNVSPTPLCANAVVTITIAPVNDAPSVADDSASTDEDTAVEIDVLANDSDSDGALDPATVMVASGPVNGGISVNMTTGAITYTPDADFNGSDAFTYQACDDGTPTPVECASATVTIAVNAVNDAPTFNNAGDVSSNEDAGAQTIPGWASSIDDGDGGTQVLTFIITNNTNPALFGAGPAVDATSGDLTYTAASDANGNAVITLVLSDDGGTSNGGADTSAPETFSIIVNPVDDPPVAIDDTATVTEDAAATTIDVLFNDIDPIDGGPISITSVTQPTNGTVVITGGGSGLTYEPDPDYCNDGGPQDEFAYTLSPGASSADVAVTVTCQNDAPTLAFPTPGVNFDPSVGPVNVSPAATFDDLDSPDLDGGLLRVDITANCTATDTLGIENQGAAAGQIGVSGVDVTFEGTVIGTLAQDAVCPPDAIPALRVDFNAAATPAAAEALLRAIQFSTTAGDTNPRVLDAIAEDGDGGTSNTASQTVNIDAAPTATSPADGDTNFDQAANITVNFSENVDLAVGAFALECDMTSVAFTPSPAIPANDVTTVDLNPDVDLDPDAICTVTVAAASVTDSDSIDPPDNMAADAVFGFVVEAAPQVTATTPADTDINVAADANVVIDFSEPVTAAAASFDLDCPSALNVALTATPNGNQDQYTLDPATDLPAGETCTVTVLATGVSDVDSIDPPDNLAGDFVFSFTIDELPTVTQSEIEVNDAADTFIALPETGTAPTATDNPDLAFVFSEAVTFNAGAFSVNCTTGGDVTGQYTAGTTPATNVTLTYSGSGLAPGETCTATLISDSIVDATGNLLDGNGDGAEDGSPADDESYDFAIDTAPSLTRVEVEVGDVFTTVAGTFPGNGVTDADLDTTIRTTFDETVNDNGGTTVACDTSGSVSTGGGGLTVAGNGSTQLVLTRNTGAFQAGESCAITFNESGITDVDNADTPDALTTPSPATYEFELVNAIATDDSFNVTTHLTARFDTTAPGTTNLLTNDTFGTGNVTAVNGAAANVGTQILLSSGAYLTVQANGDFDYTSAPGASAATDSFTYELDGADTATASIAVNGPVVWFVDADAIGPIYNGTAAFPFDDLTATGTDFDSNAPDATGDTIFVYDSANNGSGLTCGLTLLAGQTVIGEGETASLQTLTGLTPVVETLNLPATTGNHPQLSSTGDCFALNGNNTVRGLDINDTTGGAAFVDSGGTIGASLITDISVRGAGSIVEFLNGGTLTSNFTEASSTGSASAKIHLVNMAGTLDIVNGALNHPVAATDMMIVSGGTVGGSINTSFNQTGGNALLNINGGHTGTFFWNQTMSTIAGSGIQFNNADGSYNLTNTVDIEGTSAGVNIENGSDGTLEMPSNVSSIRGINGIPFRINNSVMPVDYDGGITHNQGSGSLMSARVVEIIGGTGAISFEGLIDHADVVTPGSAETIYLENTGTANTIGFGYVDSTMRDTSSIKSLTSGNISLDRGRFSCDGDLTVGGDTHCIEISDTTSSGVTFEAVRSDTDDGGDNGGAISLVNTPGTWTVEDISGGLSGRLQTLIFGNNFGTLNINTVNSGTSPGGIATGNIRNDSGEAINLTNGVVNIDVNNLTSSNSTGHGINLVNVGGPLFQTTGDLTTNAIASGNQNIFLDGVSTTTVNIGTNGTTPANVTVSQRFNNAFFANNVTSTAVNVGNFTNTQNPSGVLQAPVRIQNSSAPFTFASTTIAQGNVGDGVDEFPGNFPSVAAGPGDAIALNNNTGLLTINGGTISNVEDDAIDGREIAGINTNGLTIDTGLRDGGDRTGFQIYNPTRSSTFDIRNTTVRNFSEATTAGAPASGPRGIKLQTLGSSTATLTFDTVAFNPNTSALDTQATGMTLETYGAANMYVQVLNSAFANHFSHAVNVNHGSTGDALANVINNSFDGNGDNGTGGIYLRTTGPAGTNGNFGFAVEDNTLQNMSGTFSRGLWLNFNENFDISDNAVNHRFFNASRLPYSTVRNNIIDTPRNGITTVIDEQVHLDMLVQNNIVINVNGDGFAFQQLATYAGSSNNELIFTDNIFGTSAGPVTGYATWFQMNDTNGATPRYDIDFSNNSGVSNASFGLVVEFSSGHQSTFNMTAGSNTISSTADKALDIFSAAGSAVTACLDIGSTAGGSNTFIGSGFNSEAFVVSGAVQLEDQANITTNNVFTPGFIASGSTAVAPNTCPVPPVLN